MSSSKGAKAKETRIWRNNFNCSWKWITFSFFSRKEDIGALSAGSIAASVQRAGVWRKWTHTHTLTCTLNCNLEWFREKIVILGENDSVCPWFECSTVAAHIVPEKAESKIEKVQRGSSKNMRTKGQRCDSRIKTKNWKSLTLLHLKRSREAHKQSEAGRGLILKITKENGKWQVDGYCVDFFEKQSFVLER